MLQYDNYANAFPKNIESSPTVILNKNSPLHSTHKIPDQLIRSDYTILDYYDQVKNIMNQDVLQLNKINYYNKDILTISQYITNKESLKFLTKIYNKLETETNLDNIINAFNILLQTEIDIFNSIYTKLYTLYRDSNLNNEKLELIFSLFLEYDSLHEDIKKFIEINNDFIKKLNSFDKNDHPEFYYNNIKKAEFITEIFEKLLNDANQINMFKYKIRFYREHYNNNKNHEDMIKILDERNTHNTKYISIFDEEIIKRLKEKQQKSNNYYFSEKEKLKDLYKYLLINSYVDENNRYISTITDNENDVVLKYRSDKIIYGALVQEHPFYIYNTGMAINGLIDSYNSFIKDYYFKPIIWSEIIQEYYEDDNIKYYSVNPPTIYAKDFVKMSINKLMQLVDFLTEHNYYENIEILKNIIFRLTNVLNDPNFMQFKIINLKRKLYFLDFLKIEYYKSDIFNNYLNRVKIYRDFDDKTTETKAVILMINYLNTEDFKFISENFTGGLKDDLKIQKITDILTKLMQLENKKNIDMIKHYIEEFDNFDINDSVKNSSYLVSKSFELLLNNELYYKELLRRVIYILKKISPNNEDILKEYNLELVESYINLLKYKIINLYTTTPYEKISNLIMNLDIELQRIFGKSYISIDRPYIKILTNEDTVNKEYINIDTGITKSDWDLSFYYGAIGGLVSIFIYLYFSKRKNKNYDYFINNNIRIIKKCMIALYNDKTVMIEGIKSYNIINNIFNSIDDIIMLKIQPPETKYINNKFLKKYSLEKNIKKKYDYACLYCYNSNHLINIKDAANVNIKLINLDTILIILYIIFSLINFLDSIEYLKKYVSIFNINNVFLNLSKVKDEPSYNKFTPINFNNIEEYDINDIIKDYDIFIKKLLNRYNIKYDDQDFSNFVSEKLKNDDMFQKIKVVLLFTYNKIKGNLSTFIDIIEKNTHDIIFKKVNINDYKLKKYLLFRLDAE